MSEARPVTHAEWGVFIASKIANRLPSQRVGQVFFNELYMLSPFVAGGLVGTVDDPFYLEYVPAGALEYVRRNWYLIEQGAISADTERNYS